MKIKNLKLKIKPGLSLVELQIVIAIFAAISLVVGAAYYTGTRLFNEERETINIASQNRLAVDEITNQVREAVAVVTNCTICGSVANSDATTLILSLWPIDANGDLFEPTGDEYDYLVYRLDSSPNDTDLLKEVFPNGISSNRINTSKILAVDVKTILFEYDDVDPAQAAEVTLTITNETDTFVRTHTISQTSKSKLRNK